MGDDKLLAAVKEALYLLDQEGLSTRAAKARGILREALIALGEYPVDRKPA